MSSILYQYAVIYVACGLMYTMVIFSNPDQQVKTELMLAGMEIPPEYKNQFRFMIAFIMMVLWPLDMILRSRM